MKADINEEAPFFLEQEFKPEKDRLRFRLSKIGRTPERQVEWILEQLAEVGKVSVEDVHAAFFRRLTDDRRNRRTRVRSHYRRA